MAKVNGIYENLKGSDHCPSSLVIKVIKVIHIKSKSNSHTKVKVIH